jgi:hypothetical protein
VPVAEAVVHAVLSVLPELVGVRDEAIAAPMLRSSHLAICMLAVELGDPFVDLGAVP